MSATVWIAACGRRAETGIPPQSPIILVSVDTLRSDHLSAYGYRRIDTPAFAALASDSIVFDRAYSHCPLTLVSHASMFTGMLPADHGVRDNIGYELNPKALTAAQVLHQKGYATGAAVSAIVLRGETGISRGFDWYDDQIDFDPHSASMGRAQRRGDTTREIAQKWIAEHKAQPFFFFLHLYEPHSPYDPPEPFRSKYGATYDGDVAAADAVIGRFLQFLRDEGIYDRATVIVLSDHGEGLGDHGEDEHGIFLYREALQVPLMVKLPGSRLGGTRVASPVQLTDVYPTLIAAAGATPSAETQAISLLSSASSTASSTRQIYSETLYPRLHFGWSDSHSLIAGDQHFIHAPKPELYDLSTDGRERHNKVFEDRRTYAAMRTAIMPFLKAAEAPKAIDQEQARQLAALGYVGSAISTSTSDALPDAKDHIGLTRNLKQGFQAMQEERWAEAVPIFEALLRENPRMLDVVAMEARALDKLGRYEECLAVAKRGLRLSPGATNLAATVATVALKLNRPDEAEQHARLVLHDVPNEAHRILAEAALMKKDYARAIAEANATGATRRDKPYALILRGRVALAQEHPEEALRDYDDAAALLRARSAPPLQGLNYFRGDALARLGRGEEAEAAFLSEIREFPSDPQSYKNLILLYVTEGKTEAATRLIFALEKAAPTAPSYLAIAQTLKTVGDVNGSRFWAQRGLAHEPSDRQLLAFLRP